MVKQNSLQLQKQNELNELVVKFEELFRRHDKALAELQHLKAVREEILSEKAILYQEVKTLQEKLSSGEKLWESMEHMVFKLKEIVSDVNETDANQEKIVQEGGLDSLLSLLISTRNPTIYRVASGAIANLAMNGTAGRFFCLCLSHTKWSSCDKCDKNTNLWEIHNFSGVDLKPCPSGCNKIIYQGLIVSKVGVRLLANITAETDDPHALRMVAGAIENLCGNERLHSTLVEHGGTKALSTMFRCQEAEVTLQIA